MFKVTFTKPVSVTFNGNVIRLKRTNTVADGRTLTVNDYFSVFNAKGEER